jgi:hypothetical protein
MGNPCNSEVEYHRKELWRRWFESGQGYHWEND